MGQPPSFRTLAAEKQAESAMKLVRLSRIFALVGVVLWLPGGCTALVLNYPTLGVFVGALGFTVLVVGAVLGQIGRGMQGRII